MRTTAVLALAGFLLLSVDGCVYSRGNLERGKDGYKNYPTSIEAEHERRKTRRRHALIAAPIEIVGGLLITALALYAPSKPSDSESVTGALSDAGKDILGRLLLATAGTGFAISGVGDGILGVIDPAFDSPLVRAGKLVPASEIDVIDPPSAPRFSFHATSLLSSDGVGADFGFGLAHWIGPHVRLRHAASAELTLPFGSADRRLVASGEVLLERAFGRDGAGLYPRRALGLYVGGGWAAIEDRDDVPVLRAGLSIASARGFSYRLGTTFSRGERVPSIDFGIRSEIRTD